MKFYKIGYHSEEDSDYDTLMHEATFTKEQFDGMVEEAFTAILDLRLDEFVTRHYFDDIHSHVVNAMCKSFGFQYVVFAAQFSANGWEWLPGEEHKNDDDDTRLLKRAYRKWESRDTPN